MGARIAYPPQPAARRRAAFLRDDSGAATVEFVLVFVPLVAMMLFVVQVAMSYFFLISASNAASRGVRAAAILAPAHCAALRNSEGQPIYELDETRFLALPETPAERYCLNSPSPCLPLARTSWTCSSDGAGGDCDAAVLASVRAAMQGAGVDSDSIEITYEDSRLGEVGGRVVPLITVRVARHDFSLRSLFWRPSAQPPRVSASMIGESMGLGRARQKTCS